jgi:hypothetical protein
MNPSTVLIPKDIANVATPARGQMIETAAQDLHRAATSHARMGTGPWYIPQSAILRVLRGIGVAAYAPHLKHVST